MTGRIALALAPVARTLAVLVVAVTVAGVIYELSGYGLLDVLSGTVQGALTARGALAGTVRWTIPLILVGIGVVIGFRAGFFNVGGQGQMYVGSIAAVFVSLSWAGPPVLVVPVAISVAMVAGALWSAFPGFLRVRFGTDEVLTTLMLNFIATLLVQYVVLGALKDPAGTGQVAASRTIDQGLRISTSSGVSAILLVITALVIVAGWVLVNRTSFGLQASLAGRNPEMARWQGVSIERIGLSAFAIGGALAGLAGAVELLGPAGRVNSGFSPTLGFTAVLVALVGTLSVPGAVLAAILFGGLQSAVLFLPIVTDLPRSALDLLQGLVALLITVRFAPGLWSRVRAPRRAPGALADA